jgi:hypothetical protein
MFEGVPNFPDPSRFWQIVDKYQVNIFYGAPTALRALMREGDDWVKSTSRKSCVCSARSASRSIRKRGNGITAWSARALPDRRYLVADRNRRPHDHPAARRHMR